MPIELTAHTEPGARLLRVAGDAASEIAPCAATHDREASFPFASFHALKRRRLFLAPIPAELGGLGVDSVHDVLLASSRLASADAALALGVNMHLVYVQNVVRLWRISVAAGDQRRAQALASTIAQIADQGTVFAAASSEIGQDITRPATRATGTPDGWVVSGRKVFCSMSPAADVLYTSVAYTDQRGRDLYGYALVPRLTPGVVVHDDWDAMGMRGSASNSVSFESVQLPRSALAGGFPLGETVGYMKRNVTAGLFHAATALGIAESAHAHSTGGRRPLDAQAQLLAAQNTVELSASRATLSRAATLIDQHHAEHPDSGGSDQRLTELFAEAQSAKAFIADAGVRIADRALAMSGGAGYLNGSPLARAYRDARATAFMHPLGANRAYAFLGELAAGRTPAVH